MAIDTAAADLEATIYNREIAAGKPDSYARAFAQAFVAGFVESYEEGMATGYVQGRKLERDRLREMNREAAIHGPEAQRWLMARELDIPPVDVLLADGDPYADAEAMPPASCH